MAAARPENLGFADPFLPPVCFIFLPDLLTIEQSPTGPLGTSLSQPQVKQLSFPAWSKRDSVQMQVRRWCEHRASGVWCVMHSGISQQLLFLTLRLAASSPQLQQGAWDGDVCGEISTAPDVRAAWHKAQVLQFVTTSMVQGSTDVEEVGECVFQEVLCMGPSGEASVASAFSRQVIFGVLERWITQSHLQVVSLKTYFWPLVFLYL